MLAAVFEFIANQTNAVKVGAHGELFVLGLIFLAARASLRQCLMVQRQGQNNVAANFACMEFTAIESAKLYRMVAVEKTM